MKFNVDKKNEHEAAAEKALADRDYKAAYYHTAKAAEFGLKLAEEHDGKVRKSYLEDAEGLIEYARKLKAKYKQALANWEKAAKIARQQKKRPPRRPRPPFKAGDLTGADRL